MAEIGLSQEPLWSTVVGPRSQAAWARLDEQVTFGAPSFEETKFRVKAWCQARCFAHRCEREHLASSESVASYLRPDLDTNVFFIPSSYQFFVRLATRSSVSKDTESMGLIWEGFVPGVEASRTGRVLDFDMPDYVDLRAWPAMAAFLIECLTATLGQRFNA